MTETVIRTTGSRPESGCSILLSIDDGTITISDGELTDASTNHLRVDVENAAKLGKVLVALAAALDPDSTPDGKQVETERGDDQRALLRAMAARAARTSVTSGLSSDQLAKIDTLISRGANGEDLTPDRFLQFCEAWLQMDDRLNETQCVACGKTFTYERMGRPPLTCSADCRRKRNSKAQTRPTG